MKTEIKNRALVVEIHNREVMGGRCGPGDFYSRRFFSERG
jgi:hypothetical protein